MEEAKFLGIAVSQLPLFGLMLTILGVLIAIFAVMMNQVNALRAEMDAKFGELRSEMRADFRALEARFDALSAEVVGMKIDIAYIKGRLGIAEDVADAPSSAE